MKSDIIKHLNFSGKVILLGIIWLFLMEGTLFGQSLDIRVHDKTG